AGARCSSSSRRICRPATVRTVALPTPAPAAATVVPARALPLGLWALCLCRTWLAGRLCLLLARTLPAGLAVSALAATLLPALHLAVEAREVVLAHHVLVIRRLHLFGGFVHHVQVHIGLHALLVLGDDVAHHINGEARHHE